MKLINKDQRPRQDKLDKEYWKQVKRDQQTLTAAVCIAGVLTVIAVVLIDML